MTAQTLPDEPNFCFVPAYDVETEMQQIRIVIEGLAGHVPTALIALHLDDALTICDKLNRRLGFTREQWKTAVYVLHAFQKKARRGIATPKQALDLVRRRLRAAEQHYRDTHRGE